MEPSTDMKSMYGAEKETKKQMITEQVEGKILDETKMEIGLFSAVASAALIFIIAYYFIYVYEYTE